MFRNFLLFTVFISMGFSIDYNSWSESSLVDNSTVSPSNILIRSEVLVNGKIVAIWIGSNNYLHSAISEDGGKKWTDEISFFSSDDVLEMQLIKAPASILDEEFLLCVFSTDTEIISIQTLDGVTWNNKTVLTTGYSAPNHPRLASESTGVMCVWSGIDDVSGENGVFSNRFEASTSTWNTSAVFIFESEGTNTLPEIVCGNDGKYFVIWKKEQLNVADPLDLFYAYSNAPYHYWSLADMEEGILSSIPLPYLYESIEFFKIAVDDVANTSKSSPFIIVQIETGILSPYSYYTYSIPLEENKYYLVIPESAESLTDNDVDLKMGALGTYALFAFSLKDEEGISRIVVKRGKDAGTYWDETIPQILSVEGINAFNPSIAVSLDNNEAICLWEDENKNVLSSSSLDINNLLGNHWSSSATLLPSNNVNNGLNIIINPYLEKVISFWSDGLSFYSSYSPYEGSSIGGFNAYGIQFRKKLLLQWDISNGIYWSLVPEAVRYKIFTDSNLVNLFWEGTSLEYILHGVSAYNKYKYYVTWEDSVGYYSPAIKITLP